MTRNNVEIHAQSSRSHLFTVRLWSEELSTGRTEWRGRIQHVTSGEVHSFRDWDTLVILLRAMLPETDAGRAGERP